MRKAKILSIVLLITSVFTLLIGCTKNNSSEAVDYKNLIGISKAELIKQLGDKFEVTVQGVNNQNQGLQYNDLGLLIGVHEALEEVVEVQIINGEYFGISTGMNIDEAVEILKDKGNEVLTLQLNNIGTWYIFDLGSFRIRLSENESKNIEYVITLEDFKN